MSVVVMFVVVLLSMPPCLHAACPRCHRANFVTFRQERSRPVGGTLLLEFGPRPTIESEPMAMLEVGRQRKRRRTALLVRTSCARWSRCPEPPDEAAASRSDLGRRAYVRAHAISKGPEAVVRDHLDSIISAVFLCNVAILANTRLRSPLRASRSPHKATTPGVVAAVSPLARSRKYLARRRNVGRAAVACVPPVHLWSSGG